MSFVTQGSSFKKEDSIYSPKYFPPIIHTIEQIGAQRSHRKVS